VALSVPAAVAAAGPTTLAEARYILAEVGNNNNKFWTAARLSDNSVVATWGRVGAKPTASTKRFSSVADAASYFALKVREKEKKGYTPQQIVFDMGAALALGDAPGSSKPAKIDADLVARDILGSSTSSVTAPPNGTADVVAFATAWRARSSAGAGAQLSSTSPTVEANGAAAADAAVLERLVRYLVAQNVHEIKEATGGAMSYSSTDGLFRTPLGVVTEPAIVAARALLDRIAPLVAAGNFADVQWRALLNGYLNAVPRNVGSRRPTPQSIFPDVAALQRDHQLLDSLAGSLQVLAARRAQAAADEAAAAATAAGGSAAAPAGGQPRPRLFDVALRLVGEGEREDPRAPSMANVLSAPAPAALASGEIFRAVSALHLATARPGHASHGLRLRRLYHLDIRSMSRAHAERGAAVGNIFRLWHGTRVGNLLSILRGGLQVPPASSPHVTGRMFGDGIYGSDCSTKALNYALGAAPGQRTSTLRSAFARGDDGKGDSYFAFLADYAMGTPFEPSGFSGASGLPKPGFSSTWAKARKTGLANDEMIVYDAAQVRPLFLAEFKR
jgi:poly [ADP-ribose] polymerase